MYPGDGTGALWRSQVAMMEAARADAGWRFSIAFADMTFTNPASPNFYQFEDIADQLAGSGDQLLINLTYLVNEDTSGGWETLAADPGGWANYLAETDGKYVPPYGTDDALIDRACEIQFDGIQILIDAYEAAGHDPSEKIRATLPNEMVFANVTVGDEGEYTVPYWVEGIYTRFRARFPNLQIGSTPIGLAYGLRDTDAEIAAMVAGLTSELIPLQATYGVTWPTNVDFYCLNVYVDVGAYFSYGAAQAVRELHRKLDAAFAVFASDQLAGSTIPFWITELGVSAKDCGLRDSGRSAMKYAYLRQGLFLTALFNGLRKYPRIERAYIYALCSDDTNADRMFGLMVGADANVDGGVDGQWRLSAYPLLRMRGYQSMDPSPDSPSQNWISNPSGSTATGEDIPIMRF